MNCRDAQQFLGPYADGELDLMRSLDLEGHLEVCEACAREMRNLAELSQAVAGAPRFPAPPHLRRRLSGIQALPGRPAARHPARGWFLVAASLAGAAILLWYYLAPPTEAARAIAQEVVRDHVRSLQANHLLDVAVHPEMQAWFAEKLDYAPVMEAGSWRGFELAGARLDYLSGRPIAALVYRYGFHVVNIFVRPIPGQPERAPESRTVDSFHVVSWRAYGMDWWAVSDLSREELEQLALCPCFIPPNRTLRAGAILKPKLD